MKIFHITDKPPLFTNCFLLIGEPENGQKHAVVIDPAAPAQEFVKIIEENDAVLTHILLTHGHFDHIGSVEELKKRYGAKLYMNKLDGEHFDIKADVDYENKGTIVVDDMEFITYFTPGHTPGSTCILCKDMLFSGDTLFAGDIGRTDLPGGNMAQMRESLKMLAETIADNIKVLPGHEEFSTMAEEKRNNYYLKN